MSKVKYLLVIILFLGVFAPQGSVVTQAWAQNKDIFNSSGLPIPRFVSLRGDKVFVRTGPALRYPIKWVYKKKGLPVEIIQEFDTWRKIKDRDGEEGWIHQSLLSGRRNAVVIGENSPYLYKSPEVTAKMVVQVEAGNIVDVEACEAFWCDVKIESFSGWIERKSLWGIYDTEELN